MKEGAHTVAVLKVFREPLESALRELTALSLVRSLRAPDVQVPNVFAAGRAWVQGAPCAYLLMDAPGDTDFEALSRRAAADTQLQPTYQSYLQRIGGVLANLHAALPRTGIDADIAQTRADHLSTLAYFLRPHGPLQGFVDQGWIAEPTRLALQARVVQHCTALAAEPLANIPVGLVHGDCYPANFVLNPEKQSLHVVDLQTVMWQLSADGDGRTAHADVREDLGRFRESLLLQGLRNGVRAPTLRAEDAAFLEAYMQRQPPAMHPVLQRHEAFYRLRYDAVVFNAWHAGRHQKATAQQVRALLGCVLAREL